jgi:dTDP-4-amino-4,6-dideoxygalactose transaminase
MRPEVLEKRNAGHATVSVPLLDLKAQYATIRDDVRAALDRVCESQHFILGPEVSGLEQEIASLCGSRHGIGVSSGSDALLAALMALNIGPGDEVITTPYSFFATAGAIVRSGARPVFVDIDPETYNIDAQHAVESVGDRTRAIIPVHLFGRCAEMDPLLEVAARRSVSIIEDAAQAIGARDDYGRSAGSIGELGCFSFFPSKNLGAFGDAGMVVTSDDSLADTLRLLRVHGAKPKYHHRLVGGNFRLDALQAAILNVKLRYLGVWAAARRAHADQYRILFQEAGLEDWVTAPADSAGHVYNQFVIRAHARDELQSGLRARGIETEVYYPVPLHLQECFRGLGYAAGDFIHSERAAQESLALPVYPELTSEQQLLVVGAIAAFYLE